MDKLGVLRTYTIDPMGGVCAHWSDVVPRYFIVYIYFNRVRFLCKESFFSVSTPCLLSTQREGLGLVFSRRGRQHRYWLETYNIRIKLCWNHNKYSLVTLVSCMRYDLFIRNARDLFRPRGTVGFPKF